VRYDEFRNSLLLALREADLYSSWDRLTETIDLDTMSRTWKSSFGSGPKKEVEPFHVYGMASFRWDPLDSARTHTTEEDVVTELFGRDDELPETMQRTLRTDIVLHAKLPLDSSTTHAGREALAVLVGAGGRAALSFPPKRSRPAPGRPRHRHGDGAERSKSSLGAATKASSG
jgi:hypothetical protein